MMNVKTKLQFHMLGVLPPSNINRDDAGNPKSSFFGNAMRYRISSQAEKAAIRASMHFDVLRQRKVMSDNTRSFLVFKSEKAVEAGQEAERSYRAAALLAYMMTTPNFFTQCFKGAKLTKKTEAALLTLLKGLIADGTLYAEGGITPYSTKDALDDESNESEGDTKKKKNKKSDKKDGRMFGSAIKLKQAEQEVLTLGFEALVGLDFTDPSVVFESLTETAKSFTDLTRMPNVDVSLFGRMVAQLAQDNEAACVQFAHTIGVGVMPEEDDFFSAQDCFNSNTGASHMGHKSFTSGVNYAYVGLHIGELARRFGSGQEDLLRETIHAFVKALVMVRPSGNQSTMAASIPSPYLMVTIGETQNTQYTDAFLVPVESNDPLQMALTRLEDHHNRIVTRVGVDHERVLTWSSTKDLTALESGGEVCTTLDDIVDAIYQTLGIAVEASETAAAE